jgi:2-oxoglutarate ferredoxin oxidoreductase subunit beta
MSKMDLYKGQTPAWCPGCGNFSILETLKKALVELEIKPHEVLMVSGIGQAPKLPHYTKCHTFNGLHGRSLPVATGARLANHKMRVINITGDGDCYGEGGNHFIHTIRRNPNIAHFVHNNQIYALTKGQTSPTTAEGTRTKNLPTASASEPLNPLALAISLNASFVARAFAGDQEQLIFIMKEALLHKGYALVDILQPCVSFNKVNTYAWYKERVQPLEAKYDPTDRVRAFERALQWGDKIPTGIFYKTDKHTIEDVLVGDKETPLAYEGFSLQRAIETIESLFVK